MAAVDLYVELCKRVLASDAEDPAFWAELPTRLPRLRFGLSCRVCNKILRSPMTPKESKCQHTVCKGCVGQKMQLKPACGWCKDYDSFVDNAQLEALVRCYAWFCDYVLCFGARSRVPATATPPEVGPAGAVDLMALLEEGRGCCSEARAAVKVEPEPAAVASAAAAKTSAASGPAAAAAATATVTSTVDDAATSPAATDCQPLRAPGAPATAAIASRSPARDGSPPPAMSPASAAAVVHAVAPATSAAAAAATAAAIAAAAAASPPPASAELRGGGGGKGRMSSLLAAKQPPKPAAAAAATAASAVHPPQRPPPVIVSRPTAAVSRDAVPTPQQQHPPAKKQKRLPSLVSKQERRGCGCGTAATNPGTLTCYGQRCPCYSTRRPCIECRCRGCRNPNKAVRISHSSPESENDVEVHVV